MPHPLGDDFYLVFKDGRASLRASEKLRRNDLPRTGHLTRDRETLIISRCHTPLQEYLNLLGSSVLSHRTVHDHTKQTVYRIPA